MYALLALLYLAQPATCEYDRRTITTLKYSKYMVKPLIVNGQPVLRGQVPYIVSLKEVIGKVDGKSVWRNICGGSIISPFKVVTAAHCFESNDFYYAKHPEALRLIAGDLRNDITHTGHTETTKLGQWRSIKKVVLHKEFNFPNNDIALIDVNEPWNFTSTVDYITVAGKASDYPNYCAAAGYGRIGQSLRATLSPVLLVARIDVMSRWRCSIWWEMNMNSFICTDSAVSDVARGDSGGPLACHGTDDTNEERGKDLLVGIVSGKNFDKTTLYTRVSAFHDWIMNNSSSKLTVGLCMMIIVLVLIYLLFDSLDVPATSPRGIWKP